MSSNKKLTEDDVKKAIDAFRHEWDNLPVGVNLLPKGNTGLLDRRDRVYSGILKKFINPETGEVIEE